MSTSVKIGRTRPDKLLRRHLSQDQIAEWNREKGRRTPLAQWGDASLVVPLQQPVRYIADPRGKPHLITHILLALHASSGTVRAIWVDRNGHLWTMQPIYVQPPYCWQDNLLTLYLALRTDEREFLRVSCGLPPYGGY